MTRKWMCGAAGLVAAMSISLTACEQAFLTDPAENGQASITLNLNATNSAGGPAQAFDRADTIWVQVRDEEGVRLEKKIAVRPGGQDVPLPFDLRLKRASERLTVTVEVRFGSAVLFRGTTRLDLRTGPRLQAPLTLLPAPHALVLPDSLPVLTAYGDSVQVNGALAFATGDTVSVEPVTVWTSLDPSVVAVQGDVPIARADGAARLVGRSGTMEDTTRVRVFAVVTSITVQPDTTAGPISFGNSRQYTAQMFDRRGNRLDRPVTWISSNPQIVRIDGNGLATALALGTATVSATSGTGTSALAVRVRAFPPVVKTDTATLVMSNAATLNATINSNRFATDAWFRYATDSLFVVDSVTTPVIQIAGDQAADGTDGPIVREYNRLIGGLKPATTYWVRAFGRNVAGTTTGNMIKFTTPAQSGPAPPGPPGPPLPGGLQIITRPPGSITPTTARIFGTVTPGSTAVTAWLEWGSTQSAFADSLELSNLPAGGAPTNLTANLGSLQPGVTYYYRAAARNAIGVYYGTTMSFKTTSGSCGSVGGSDVVASVGCSRVPKVKATILEPRRY